MGVCAIGCEPQEGQGVSSTPPPESAGPDAYQPEPDDADTGPLPGPPVVSPADDVRASSTPGPWAGRFDGPMMVSPRPVRTMRPTRGVLGAIAAVLAVVVVGGLILWLFRPSSDEQAGPSEAAPAEPPAATPEPEPSPDDGNQARLQVLLPPGYPPDACQPVPSPNDALAQLDCGQNTDPDGPTSATYTLFGDKAALDAAFNAAMATAQRVDCPNRIQSPGPWRRNATPDEISGVLFCGLKEGRPTVAWSDDTKLVLSVVRSGPDGPTFPALYAWWSSHS